MSDLRISNSLFLHSFLNIKSNFRLCGNGGISCFQAAFGFERKFQAA